MPKWQKRLKILTIRFDKSYFKTKKKPIMQIEKFVIFLIKLLDLSHILYTDVDQWKLLWTIFRSSKRKRKYFLNVKKLCILSHSIWKNCNKNHHLFFWRAWWFCGVSYLEMVTSSYYFLNTDIRIMAKKRML